MLILGLIVTGTHQARRTANAATDSGPAKVAFAVQAAVKALVVFPFLVRWSLMLLDGFESAAEDIDGMLLDVV